MHRFLALLVVAASIGASAQPVLPETGQIVFRGGTPRPTLPSNSPAAHIERLMNGPVARSLALGNALEGRLLTAAREMAQAQQQRIRALLEQWAREAQADPALAPHLAQVLQARLANAYALWGLDSLGPAHDERLLQALQDRSACYRPQLLPLQGELEARLARLRNLPLDVLALALADERELLARFGTARALPRASDPVALDPVLERIRNNGARAEPPLSPTLRLLFVDIEGEARQDPRTTANLNLRCGIYQWALDGELARAQTPAARREALTRWREGVRPTLSDFSGVSLDDAAGAAPGRPVPDALRQFGISGSAQLLVEVDPFGRVQKTTVMLAQPRVRGLPAGERPAAFEALFTLASERRVQGMNFPQPRPTDGRNKSFVHTLNWEQP